MKLLLMSVFFGERPAWAPLLLKSMQNNKDVNFVIVGDLGYDISFRQEAGFVQNLKLHDISWENMLNKVSNFALGRVQRKAVVDPYKANDFKPLLPALFPETVKEFAYTHVGWCDIDVIFGDIGHYLSGVKEEDVMTPFYPNPWRKAAWGPLTIFKTSHSSLFLKAERWHKTVTQPDYRHFDEFWGAYRHRTMGHLIKNLSLKIYNKRTPYAEASVCGGTCLFCPCGAVGFRIDKKLYVHGTEVVLLHLGKSKAAWKRVGDFSPLLTVSSCVRVDGLGGGVSKTQLRSIDLNDWRLNKPQDKMLREKILYYTTNDTHAKRQDIKVGACS